MTDEEDAVAFVKQKKKELIEKFASEGHCPAYSDPLTLFMAGSPGAGKTEFSKKLISGLQKINPDLKIIRIDPDEIRAEIPLYNGKNSSVVQHACLIGARNIFYSALKHGQNFIYDGTLASYDSAKKDIEDSIKKGRKVGIFYLFQDPVVSWYLTKKREVVEGRPVPKDVFIKAFFASRDNVNRIKSDFGKSVTVYFIEKNFEKNTLNYRINVDKIEPFIKNEYNADLLERTLKEDFEAKQ